MCKPKDKKRFLSVYKHKYSALVRFIDPANAHFSALKTAERISCANRYEVFDDVLNAPFQTI